MRLIADIMYVSQEAAKKAHKEIVSEYGPGEHTLGSEGSLKLDYENPGYKVVIWILIEIFRSKAMSFKIKIDY